MMNCHLHEVEKMEITRDELKAIIKQATNEAIKEYCTRQNDARVVNTWKLLKSYRDAVFFIENAVTDTGQISTVSKKEQVTVLRNIKKSKYKTIIMKAHIDAALEEIQHRKEKAGRGVEYAAFDMYFMQGLTYEEIAGELNTGKNTPRRWINAIVKELSVLLWGITDE